MAGDPRPERGFPRPPLARRPQIRLLAVAALVGGSVIGVLLAGSLLSTQPVPPVLATPSVPDDGLSSLMSCARIEDYPAPGESPPDAPLDPFPAQVPAAVPGAVLEDGDAVTIGDDDGPGAIVRGSNIRFCERYPTVRPTFAPAFVVAHWEIRLTRSGFLDAYLPPGRPLVSPTQTGLLGLNQADALRSRVPGSTPRTQIAPAAGLEHASDLVWEVSLPKRDNLQIDVRLTDDLRAPALASWRGPVAGPTGDGIDLGPLIQVPDQPAATGTVALGAIQRVEVDGVFGIRVGDVDVVPRYPERDPMRPGDVFVEVRILYGAGQGGIEVEGPGSREWTARDGSDAPLPLLTGRDGAGDLEDQRMLWPLLTPEGGGMWLVIEAPRTGEVRLEYRRHGEGPVLFDVIVREG